MCLHRHTHESFNRLVSQGFLFVHFHSWHVLLEVFCDLKQHALSDSSVKTDVIIFIDLSLSCPLAWVFSLNPHFMTRTTERKNSEWHHRNNRIFDIMKTRWHLERRPIPRFKCSLDDVNELTSCCLAETASLTFSVIISLPITSSFEGDDARQARNVSKGG